MESKNGRKLVSKGEYIARKTLALSLSGCVFACGLAMLLLLRKVPYCAQISASWEQAEMEATNGEYFTIINNDALLYLCIFLVFLLLVAFVLQHQSRKVWKAVKATQPISSANTAKLPAPESLVRASSEPEQAQEAVLLRAAGEGKESQPEELVRASVGKR